eukprot:scaffold106482_cov66-Phaeocystis_antarctica.AAC.2
MFHFNCTVAIKVKYRRSSAYVGTSRRTSDRCTCTRPPYTFGARARAPRPAGAARGARTRRTAARS